VDCKCSQHAKGLSIAFEPVLEEASVTGILYPPTQLTRRSTMTVANKNRVEFLFPRMAERRVTNIVGEASACYGIRIRERGQVRMLRCQHAEDRKTDLFNFQRMGESVM